MPCESCKWLSKLVTVQLDQDGQGHCLALSEAEAKQFQTKFFNKDGDNVTEEEYLCSSDPMESEEASQEIPSAQPFKAEEKKRVSFDLDDSPPTDLNEAFLESPAKKPKLELLILPSIRLEESLMKTVQDAHHEFNHLSSRLEQKIQSTHAQIECSNHSKNSDFIEHLSTNPPFVSNHVRMSPSKTKTWCMSTYVDSSEFYYILQKLKQDIAFDGDFKLYRLPNKFWIVGIFKMRESSHYQNVVEKLISIGFPEPLIRLVQPLTLHRVKQWKKDMEDFTHPVAARFSFVTPLPRHVRVCDWMLDFGKFAARMQFEENNYDDCVWRDAEELFLMKCDASM